jgi:hypothetical protein
MTVVKDWKSSKIRGVLKQQRMDAVCQQKKRMRVGRKLLEKIEA